jgi:hypothetical protein
MKKIWCLIFLLMTLSMMVSNAAADNYVNWRGGFWFEIPKGWEKVDYRMVDAFLSMTDTSRDVYNYEAVFAPESSMVFAEEAYLVVTFDSTGPMTQKQSDSVLQNIAESYSTDVFDAPIVQLMSDLTPGQPKMNRAERTVSILSEMAYRPEAMKKLWLYMKLNDRGLISLYFYSPDSSYQANKPIFDKVLKSLSFKNLKEAAAQENVVFTGVGGDSLGRPEAPAGETGAEGAGAKGGISSIRNILLYAVVIIVVFGLLWNFVIGPRLKKK